MPANDVQCFNAILFYLFTFLLFKDAYLPFYDFFPQYLAIEFFRVEPYGTLLHLFTAVDRASVVFGEDDGAGGALPGTGGTIVLSTAVAAVSV